MRQEKDLVLINSFKNGNAGAFDELYKAYKRTILNYLYRMTNNRTMAEELTQETFVKVYTNIDKYMPTGSFSSWVYAIARNLAKNEFKKAKNVRKVSFDSKLSDNSEFTLSDILTKDGTDASDYMNNAEIEESIQSVLLSMPPEFREVITLCVIQELSYEDAARVIGCTKSVVAVRLFRGRKLFVKCLKGRDNG
ncbi:MAG: sigma-70 family RNA polymerase sigma factor [Candidatus Omnitrophica bacterium]|nr:sigma-70 family RNA polymerase sigma factor [Candidatus Omnitrophota bacterium]